MTDLLLTRVDPAQPAAQSLIASLDAELLQRYPDEAPNGIDAAEFNAAGGCFLLATRGTQAIGCGAFRPVDHVSVEIKRVYVVSSARGAGVARVLLGVLEQYAVDAGFTRAILETGLLQPEAIALYQSCGYQRTPPFAPYLDNPASVCFEKRLPMSNR